MCSSNLKTIINIKMKRILFIAAVVALGFTVSCKGGEGENTTDGTTDNSAEQPKNEYLENMIMVSLLEHGLPLWVYVPDTLMAKLNVTVKDWGQVEVRSGGGFQIQITEGGDLELKKSDINSDLLYTDVKFIAEEADGIVYSQGIKGDEYFQPMNHFYAVKNINGIDYEFQDIRGDVNFPERAVVKMFEVVKATEADDRKPS